MKIFDFSKEKQFNILYIEAEKFLDEINPGVDLDKYLYVQKTFKTKKDIFYRILISLQNRQMSSNVIGFEKDDRNPIFNKILFGFDSDKILEKYDSESLFGTFQKHFEIKNAESKSNLWRLYAKSIISAAKFMKLFKSADDFDEFVNRFIYNEASAAALPMLLEKEIVGFGFPLACDFLKELGYDQYPKPDVHIKAILTAFGLCEDNDYSAYKTVIEMAKVVGSTPYKVDKCLWLIGSGTFYKDKDENGKEMKAKEVDEKMSNRDAFIERVRKKEF